MRIFQHRVAQLNDYREIKRQLGTGWSIKLVWRGHGWRREGQEGGERGSYPFLHRFRSRRATSFPSENFINGQFLTLLSSFLPPYFNTGREQPAGKTMVLQPTYFGTLFLNIHFHTSSPFSLLHILPLFSLSFSLEEEKKKNWKTFLKCVNFIQVLKRGKCNLEILNDRKLDFVL